MTRKLLRLSALALALPAPHAAAVARQPAANNRAPGVSFARLLSAVQIGYAGRRRPEAREFS